MIANIKTRVDFGGIVNYANDQKNKKKSATLLAHKVFALSVIRLLRTLSRYRHIHAPESEKSRQTRFFSLLTARCGSFPQR